MEYDGYEDIDYYVSDLENAITIIRLRKVFDRLSIAFTMDEFVKSFRTVFKEEGDESLDALYAALETEVIHEVEDDKFSFNGITFNCGYMN
jgi:hypothetical protein